MKPTFEEYISECEAFAQPILKYLRELIHRECPSIREEIKWNFPYFTYKGKNFVFMAGFKQHATLGFGLSPQMSDHHKVFVVGENMGMGNFGKLSNLKDLPSEEILVEYLHEAMSLHDQGLKERPQKRNPVKKIPHSPIFIEALKREKIDNQFQSFSPSQQNEYHEWVSDAKTEKTRDKRIIQAIEWISEGKPRNWKYMKNWKGKT